MREIKFRCWNHILKNFTYLNLFPRHNLELFFKNFPFEYIGGGLQQYTGLKDMNDKEIYEGDILQAIYSGEEAPEILIGIVNFDDEEAVYTLAVGDNKDYLFNTQVDIYSKVIGNIYENPELLKG